MGVAMGMGMAKVVPVFVHHSKCVQQTTQHRPHLYEPRRMTHGLSGASLA